MTGSAPLESTAIVELLGQIEAGDSTAENQLWNKYFEILRQYVANRVRLIGPPCDAIDDEAVAASAFESIFKCIRSGKFQHLEDWKELTKLAYSFTRRKLVDHRRRMVGPTRHPASPLRSLSDPAIQVGSDPGFDEVEFRETVEHLMSLLPDEETRRIAVLKLAGFTLDEIGQQVNRAIPTVNRKWRLIRQIWASFYEQ